MEGLSKRGGFTLVELTVVLFIFTLVASVAVRQVSTLDARWLHSEAMTLRLRLNHAVDLSLMNHEMIAWHYDSGTNSYEFVRRSVRQKWEQSGNEAWIKHHLQRPVMVTLERGEAAENAVSALAFLPGGEYTPFNLLMISPRGYGYVLVGDGLNDVVLDRWLP